MNDNKQPDSVYTIPARTVVPGMLLPLFRGARVLVVADSLPASLDGKTSAMAGIVSIETMGGDHVWCEPEAMIDIMIPGPSPRELLCSCSSEYIGGPQRSDRPALHELDCPVRNLRLRLWPVHGLDFFDGFYRLSQPVNARVDRTEIAGLEWLYPDRQAFVRSVFCEPTEPTEVRCDECGYTAPSAHAGRTCWFCAGFESPGAMDDEVQL